MHSWVNRAVELAHTAKESVKGHRREREKLKKLEDQYSKRRKGGLLMFDASTLERQRRLVHSLQVRDYTDICERWLGSIGVVVVADENL